MKEEEELLEGPEEGPLREDADALVAEDLPLRLGAILGQVEALPLLLGQPLFGVLLVEGDGGSVDLGSAWMSGAFSFPIYSLLVEVLVNTHTWWPKWI